MKKLVLIICMVLSVLLCISKNHPGIYNVLDYGAKGDRITVNTSAIQTAIIACNESGGGTVYFPAGDYISGEIRLLDNVKLYLDQGATIWASRRPKDYNSKNVLIHAKDVENIAIEGTGTLYGIGEKDLYRRPELEYIHPEFRAQTLLFNGCKNISIRDIRIFYSDGWTVNLYECEDVIIDGVTIKNNYFHSHSDGIDPKGCNNVIISNCNITAGDDCIVLKTSNNLPCENVVVTNCILESVSTAIKFGTESSNDFRNIHFSNCVIRNSTVGIGIFLKDGGTIERVSFSNITVENCTDEVLTNVVREITPIFVDIEKRYQDSRIGKINDITFDNINISSGYGALIQGMPESPIENLTIKNVNFRVNKPAKFTDRIKHFGSRERIPGVRDSLYIRKPSYITLAYVNGLTVENIKLYSSKKDFDLYERSAFSAYDTKNGIIRNVYRNQVGTDNEMPILLLDNCKNILVTDFVPLPLTPVVIGINGEKTSNITIKSAGMGGASKIYNIKNAPRNKVILKK